jgi:hypothetical protein
MIDSEKIYTDVTSKSENPVWKRSQQVIILKSHLDEILAPYGKEMTWDMKAGCMGKRKTPLFLSFLFQ